jgi:hypothetical protein
MNKICKWLAMALLCSQEMFSQPLPNDLVINEILFNPTKDGYDYIEVYNRSANPILLNEVMIASRKSNGGLNSVRIITKDSLAVGSGSYCVITADNDWVRQHYHVPGSAIILELSSLPSFPDDEGSVVLVRKKDSAVIDEVTYSEKWHFRMLSDPTGVALERISADRPSQSEYNWTSASSASGYGTPGVLNSQSRTADDPAYGISVLPKIISPDNDGRDDFAQINIGSQSQGKVANAVIYDGFGKRIRYLLKNELLGNSNTFTWDGLDDRSQIVSPGIYILLTRIFDTSGYSTKFKNCIVIR